MYAALVRLFDAADDVLVRDHVAALVTSSDLLTDATSPPAGSSTAITERPDPAWLAPARNRSRGRNRTLHSHFS
ncbi:hypothetical protein [Actinophytocola sp.]|uniref:hypothetical protein n=1 Tax=Actinophytocola sp. TaxID=1872138 RepID=UPI00389B151C